MTKNNSKYIISGERVRTVRKELDGRKILNPYGGTYSAKVSQAVFAEIADISIDTLNSIESGRRRLTKENAEKISEIAQVPAPVDWLMGETDIRNAFDAYVASLGEVEQETLSFNSAVMVFYDAVSNMGLNVNISKAVAIKEVVSNEKWDRIPADIKLSLADYEIRNGENTVLNITNDEMKRFQMELTRYARFMLEGMIQKGGTENGEH